LAYFVTKVQKKTLLGSKIGINHYLCKQLSNRHRAMNEFLELEEKIVEVLKTVYDPEIPVNIYDLGLIYRIETNDGNVEIDMTLTTPSCPMADFIIEDVRMKVEGIAGVKKLTLNLVFEPEWTHNSLSDEVKLELGLL